MRIPLIVVVVKVICMSLLPLVNSVLISKLQIVWLARVEFVGHSLVVKYPVFIVALLAVSRVFQTEFVNLFLLFFCQQPMISRMSSLL